MSKSAATVEIFMLNLRRVTSSYNHRNALSDKLRKDGYGVFKEDVPLIEGKEPTTPLWELATSEDPAQRQQFVELIEKYENPKEVKDSVISLGYNIMNVGQISAINVRDNGGSKDKEEHTYQLVAGHRRSLAMLYIWCKGLTRTPDPRAKAVLIKGNHQLLQAISISENIHRKALTLIEQATAYLQAVNTGESTAEIANREGVSEATIKNRISLLELSPQNQERVANGTLKYTKALEMVKNAKGGRGETTDEGEDGEGAAVRAASSTKKNMLPRKTVEQLHEEEANPEAKRAFALVLRLIDLPEPEADEEEASEEEALTLSASGELVASEAPKKGKKKKGKKKKSKA